VLLMLVLLTVEAAAQSAAQPPAPPRDARVAPVATAAGLHTPARAPAPAQHPDAALLEYLGEFDDAADGLDAMGLEESTQGNGKDNDGKSNGGRR